MPEQPQAECDVQEFNTVEEKLYKLRKILPTGMPEEFDAMDEEALRKRIVDSEANIHDTEQAKENDLELQNLKERVKEASASYRDAKKAQTAIVQYCTIMLRKQGKV